VPLLEQVLEKYPSDVKVVFKNFPLRNHKFAMKAATAAYAARSQGKFWEFHDLLFKNYNKLNDEKVKEIARELGLNESELEEKMKDQKIMSTIRRDSMEGNRAGVRGTPTIFVNGRRLKNRSLQGFQAAIDKELKKKNENLSSRLLEKSVNN
jgi:protein-disulfide isomerase